MKSDTFYFPHDYNAIHDPKITKLRMKYGMEGYGVYWALIEQLYNNANALQLDCECIAFELRVDASVVQGVITEFDLFEIDAQEFGSLSVERRLSKREAISKKRSANASKRWESSKKSDASAMQVHTESDANAKQIYAKEKKGKEKKRKESKVNTQQVEFGTFWDVYDLKVDRAKCESKWKRMSDEQRTDAIEYAKRYREHHEKVNKMEFLPRPLTYLNGQRWKDEQMPYENLLNLGSNAGKEWKFDEQGNLIIP